MLAIISDIHSNLEALEVVLADIDRRGITDIVCLGDVVGYGPNPIECLDLVRRRCRLCLMGNHDHAVFYEPANFNLPAERASYWSRQLFEDEPDAGARNERWAYFGNMPVRHVENDMLFVHGSPRRPINEYLFPEDVFTNPQKVMANFDRLEARVCFVGHTHQPGVFLDDPYFDPPHELVDAPYFELRDERAIINVGSVGQPRDRDPRASYVIVSTGDEDLLDESSPAAATGNPVSTGKVSAGEKVNPAAKKSAGAAVSPTAKTTTAAPSGMKKLVDAAMDLRQVEFIRLDYDIEKTVKKILSEPALDDFLGHRLYDGR